MRSTSLCLSLCLIAGAARAVDRAPVPVAHPEIVRLVRLQTANFHGLATAYDNPQFLQSPLIGVAITPEVLRDVLFNFEARYLNDMPNSDPEQRTRALNSAVEESRAQARAGMIAAVRDIQGYSENPDIPALERRVQRAAAAAAVFLTSREDIAALPTQPDMLIFAKARDDERQRAVLSIFKPTPNGRAHSNLAQLVDEILTRISSPDRVVSGPWQFAPANALGDALQNIGLSQTYRDWLKNKLDNIIFAGTYAFERGDVSTWQALRASDWRVDSKLSIDDLRRVAAYYQSALTKAGKAVERGEADDRPEIFKFIWTGYAKSGLPSWEKFTQFAKQTLQAKQTVARRLKWTLTGAWAGMIGAMLLLNGQQIATQIVCGVSALSLMSWLVVHILNKIKTTSAAAKAEITSIDNAVQALNQP